MACGYARLETLRSETGGKFLGRGYTISEIATLTDIPQSGTSVKRNVRKTECPQRGTSSLVLPEEEIIPEEEVKTTAAHSGNDQISLALQPDEPLPTKTPLALQVTGLWIIDTYNAETPADHTKHRVISELRRKRADEYARRFPDPEFWHAVFAEVERSPWLRGKVASNGREPQKRGLFWMLQCEQGGGQENCVKVYEGNYRDESGSFALPQPRRVVL